MPEELPLVPTLADMVPLGIRAEALRGVSDEVKQAQLEAAFDWLACRLAKRVTRPLLSLDDKEARKTICLRAAAESIRWQRGSGTASQDATIKDLQAEADKYINDIRTGAIEVLYTDSTSTEDEQGPYGGGDATADAWVKVQCPAGYYPGYYP